MTAPVALDLPGDHDVDRRLLLAVLGVGVALDVATRCGLASTGAAAGGVAVAAALVAQRRHLVTRTSRVLVGTVPLVVAWLAVRSSGWLLLPDVAVAVALLAVGCSYGRDVTPRPLTAGALARRCLMFLPAAALAAPALWDAPARPRLRGGGDVARGLALALPVVIVLGALLASADAVFASLVVPDVSPGPLLWHLGVVVVGAAVTGGLLRVAVTDVSDAVARPARLGTTEATVVLASLVVLFSAFAAAQAWATAGGADHVLRSAGLTYAEHARRGFFQLVVVAAITLTVLLAVRATTDRDDPAWNRRFTTLATAASVLAIVIVGVSLQRLWLYQQAYGLTMLRLAAAAASAWIGACFVLLVGAVAGRLPERRFVPACAVAALALLLLGNVADPESLVVRHNVDLSHRTGELDVGYLAGLSDDAVPELVRSLDAVPPPVADALRLRLCNRERPGDGLLGTSVAGRRAAAALRTACP